MRGLKGLSTCPSICRPSRPAVLPQWRAARSIYTSVNDRQPYGFQSSTQQQRQQSAWRMKASCRGRVKRVLWMHGQLVRAARAHFRTTTLVGARGPRSTPIASQRVPVYRDLDSSVFGHNAKTTRSVRNMMRWIILLVLDGGWPVLSRRSCLRLWYCSIHRSKRSIEMPTTSW